MKTIKSAMEPVTLHLFARSSPTCQHSANTPNVKANKTYGMLYANDGSIYCFRAVFLKNERPIAIQNAPNRNPRKPESSTIWVRDMLEAFRGTYEL